MSEAEKRCRSYFLKNCTKYNKKHGHWAVIRFEEEKSFICMDTWNGSMHYKKGYGLSNYWTGFAGESVFYFGLDEAWRASDPPKYPDNVFDYFYEKMKKLIEST